MQPACLSAASVTTVQRTTTWRSARLGGSSVDPSVTLLFLIHQRLTTGTTRAGPYTSFCFLCDHMREDWDESSILVTKPKINCISV